MVRRNPIQSRFPRRPMMANIPGSVPWVLFVVLAPAVAVPLAYLSSSRAAEPVPPAPQVETRIDTQGYDKHQRALPFTIYVLTQEFSWRLESTADLEGGQTLVNAELAAAINRAQDVFCVGTASFEGVTQREEARAAQRAGTLAEWLRKVVRDPKHTHLFTLNAGQYAGPQDLQSTNQRKAIVITTGQHADNVDLSEALTSGLEQQQRTYPVVYSLLHHYSRSDKWLAALHAGRAYPPQDSTVAYSEPETPRGIRRE